MNAARAQRVAEIRREINRLLAELVELAEAREEPAPPTTYTPPTEIDRARVRHILRKKGYKSIR